MKRLWMAEMFVWESCFGSKSPLKLKCSFSSFSAVFQGGAEHNVPVVISKIFKDQVGKKVFYLSAVTPSWK